MMKCVPLCLGFPGAAAGSAHSPAGGIGAGVTVTVTGPLLSPRLRVDRAPMWVISVPAPPSSRVRRAFWYQLCCSEEEACSQTAGVPAPQSGGSEQPAGPEPRTPMPGSATEPSPGHAPGSASGPGAAVDAGDMGLHRTGRSLSPWSSHSRGKARKRRPGKHAPGVTSDGGEWYPEEKTGWRTGKGLSGGGDCGQVVGDLCGRDTWQSPGRWAGAAVQRAGGQPGGGHTAQTRAWVGTHQAHMWHRRKVRESRGRGTRERGAQASTCPQGL